MISVKTGGGKVKVVTEKGVEDEFDEVVMTAPLGYLQRNQDIFAPPLPPRLVQAIDAIGYGSLEKVWHLKFLCDSLEALTLIRST